MHVGVNQVHVLLSRKHRVSWSRCNSKIFSTERFILHICMEVTNILTHLMFSGLHIKDHYFAGNGVAVSLYMSFF